MTRSTRLCLYVGLLLTLARIATPSANAGGLELNRGDHICYIGNTMADRMQHHAWLETYIHALHPQHDLVFRNLAFPGDEIKTRSRSQNFGSPDQWLTKCEADVVFCFFGYNEALRGKDALAGFEKDLAGMIDGMRLQKYNGSSPPRLVVFSPIAHENLNSPHVPDGSANNEKLALYTTAMNQVCEAKGVLFVDLFAPTQKLYETAKEPLTMNGIHLLDNGNKAVAEYIGQQLFPGTSRPDADAAGRIREAVLDKNYHWFSRYRVVDGYNVYGGRSKLAWHGQSNADVMRREMEIFDVMTANRDRRVWAVAQGGDLDVKDDNLPQELVVQTNKVGPLEDGRFPYLGGEEAIDKMTIAEGLEANLYASEEMFPRFINPVQMAVDTDSRLWASVWPSYPHWNPTEPRKDALVILPDEDGNGVADECIVFADELNSITGFEFWGGGVLVFAPPELWFLKDTDGDDKADFKLRMLQGVSSADTHHSANAVVMGPDGWLYWSRGVFNVANFETPTKTYRSGSTGVHRFNPRTFEVEFHFPIGPNPHGDVIDRWGYQFVNDGTGGTGSYVNIGKGMGNKKWFQKRVRPVPATGLLSSSHFPERNDGNFLICNAIGFLGVLQHEVKYNGADITAVEIEPIVYSADPNFRPTDLEVGGDGALYVSDWCNTLIGHMQHNMRDPNRDNKHGRVYRFTAKGRSLLKPAKMKGKPVEEVCENFFARENSTRYRARLELSGHDRDKLLPQVTAWASDLSPANDAKERDEAQALLECLWVFEEHRMPNLNLLKTVIRAKEPRVRAAAIRTLGHWAGKVNGWEDTLAAAARDESALVRAEAVKAAVDFQEFAAANVIFEVATRPGDPELDAVLNYARGKIKVDQMIADAAKSGRQLSPAAQAYALQKASASVLLTMERSDAVYNALLSRASIPAKARWEAIAVNARQNRRSESEELVAQITVAEKEARESLEDLARMLATSSVERLTGLEPALAKLASDTTSSAVRKAAYTAWLRAGAAQRAWDHAVKSRSTLGDLLSTLQKAKTVESHAELFASIRPLMFELPEHLRDADGGDTVAPAGGPISFEYYQPNPATNVALETLDKAQPKLTGTLEQFETFVPEGSRDAFATRQTSTLIIPESGSYTFFTSSDDGSRLYIDKKLVVDNDGKHGMSEKNGKTQLDAGPHEIIVTYFDNGGGDGLRVSWQGPGLRKQLIPASALRSASGGNLRVLAINTIARWPGHLDEKVQDFAALVAADSLTTSALNALATLPSRRVVDRLSPESADAILKAAIGYADQATPVQRQSDEFSRLLGLGNSLLVKISSDREAASRELAALKASIPVKADPKVLALGKQVYMRHSHCATCHQPHGQGLPNLYPPLDGSLWATGSEDRLIRLVLDGMHGTIEVNGKTYSSPPLPPMTGFRQLLKDQEIAAVLTYVRNTWSNRARPIEPAKVASIRAIDRGGATFWYAANLLEKFPLEDGRVVSKPAAGAWIPKFVKQWEHSDFTNTDLGAGNRSFDNGKLFFGRLGCSQCHKLGDTGGVFGPDLSKLEPKKRKHDYILQSILDPSKDVEAKFAVRAFILDSGKVVTGLIAKETPDELHVITDPLAPNKPTIVKKNEVEEETKTAASIMPKGMLNWLTEEEILDLLAYVLAGGNDKDEAFIKKTGG